MLYAGPRRWLPRTASEILAEWKPEQRKEPSSGGSEAGMFDEDVPAPLPQASPASIDTEVGTTASAMTCTVQHPTAAKDCDVCFCCLLCHTQPVFLCGTCPDGATEYTSFHLSQTCHQQGTGRFEADAKAHNMRSGLQPEARSAGTEAAGRRYQLAPVFAASACSTGSRRLASPPRPSKRQRS